jgi:hypothetical protein
MIVCCLVVLYVVCLLYSIKVAMDKLEFLIKVKLLRHLSNKLVERKLPRLRIYAGIALIFLNFRRYISFNDTDLIKYAHIDVKIPLNVI